MKKKKIVLICLLAFGLSACQSQNLETQEQTQVTTETSVQNTIREQRDELELEQRMDYDVDRQSTLSGLAIPLDEEDEQIQAAGYKIFDELSSGDSDAAVDTIMDADWFKTMLPKLVIGQRNYVTEDEIPYKITVISDELGQVYIGVQCANTEGQLVYMERTPSEIRLLRCDYQNQKMKGNFSSEVLCITDGNYQKYEGTMTQEGKVEGTIKLTSATVNKELNVLEMWKTRNTDANFYEGELDENEESAIKPEQLGIYTMWD